MTPPVDDDPIDRARGVFAARVEALDPATVSALRARRRDALAAMPREHGLRWWWPAGGLVTAALALAIVLPRSASIDAAPENRAMAADTATAPTVRSEAEPNPRDAAERAAEFADAALVELDNDAAFYAWLATLPAEPGEGTPAAAPDSPEPPQEG